MEIERKFLINTPPDDLEQYKQAEIEQAYISVEPTIRLRKQNNDYYLTIKQKGFMAREEMEITITKEQFTRLWDKIETGIIRKTRFFIPLHEKTAELDVYRGVLQGLITVEVEFNSIDQANSFNPPNWFGREVTNNPKYSNSALAVSKLLD